MISRTPRYLNSTSGHWFLPYSCFVGARSFVDTTSYWLGPFSEEQGAEWFLAGPPFCTFWDRTPFVSGTLPASFWEPWLQHPCPWVPLMMPPMTLPPAGKYMFIQAMIEGRKHSSFITDALFWPETDGDLPLPAGDGPTDGLLLDDDGFYVGGNRVKIFTDEKFQVKAYHALDFRFRSWFLLLLLLRLRLLLLHSHQHALRHILHSLVWILQVLFERCDVLLQNVFT